MPRPGRWGGPGRGGGIFDLRLQPPLLTPLSIPSPLQPDYQPPPFPTEERLTFLHLKLGFVQRCPIAMMSHYCTGFPIYHFGVDDSLPREEKGNDEGDQIEGVEDMKVFEEEERNMNEEIERVLLCKVVERYQRGGSIRRWQKQIRW